MNSFLTKEESNFIKGVAIILMLFHHLFAFPDKIGNHDILYIFPQFFTRNLGSIISVVGR